MADPHADPATWRDPVFEKLRCLIVRPVARIVVQTISVIRFDGVDTGFPGADIAFTVAYANGQSWSTSITFFPSKFQDYGLFSRIHLDCWSSADTFAFYSGIFSPVPRGVDYYSGDPSLDACTP